MAPDGPRNVEARAVGATSIEVTWQASANATSYAVQRRESGVETEFTTIAPNVVTTAFTDSTATTDSTYEYRLVAQNANGSSPASQAAQATAGQSNLTAYRPQGVQLTNNPQPGPLYDRFPRTQVTDENENSSTFGPGIRINADDDNQNFVQDRSEPPNANPQENDLIEVKIDRVGTGSQYLVTGSRLKLYLHYDRTGPIESFEPLNFVNNQLKVFVEWVDSTHGTDSLSLVDATTMTTLNTVRFHSFRSMVVVFGGAFQSPYDDNGDGNIGDPTGGFFTGGPANEEGIFDAAMNLYVEGWDVYPYNEDEVDDPLDLPFVEITNAIDRRFVGFNFDTGVGGIAILGYSQGGGATHDLIERLWDERNIITDFGMYLDAQEHDLPEDFTLPETRWPEGCFSLLSIYQRLGPFVGDDIPDEEALGFLEEYNVTIDAGWDHSLNHFFIDDDVQVKAALRIRVEDHLQTR